jgi:cysteinyl-tRNA synthetase
MMNGKKIAKSDGNVAYLSEARERWFSGEDVRLFYLQAHYRSFHDFTWQWLENAKKTRHNIIRKIYNIIIDWTNINSVDVNTWLYTQTTWEIYTMIWNFLADDLDTVQVLAHISTILKDWKVNDITDILTFDRDILKLWLTQWVIELLEASTAEAPQSILDLAQQRIEAKDSKDYATADSLREQIAQSWRLVKDTADGFELTAKD